LYGDVSGNKQLFDPITVKGITHGEVGEFYIYINIGILFLFTELGNDTRSMRMCAWTGRPFDGYMMYTDID